MLPTREEALKLIRDGLLFNPGPWGKHCLTAAHCAEKIASACGDMDVEKAYILGLLHDIGRKFGVRHLGHVYDGYVYMKSLGYDEVAKICLTHSFNNHTIDEYIGKFDVTDEELTIIKTELAKTIYDEYDRLIQLCDCLAGADAQIPTWVPRFTPMASSPLAMWSTRSLNCFQVKRRLRSEYTIYSLSGVVRAQCSSQSPKVLVLNSIINQIGV